MDVRKILEQTIDAPTFKTQFESELVTDSGRVARTVEIMLEQAEDCFDTAEVYGYNPPTLGRKINAVYKIFNAGYLIREEFDTWKEFSTPLTRSDATHLASVYDHLNVHVLADVVNQHNHILETFQGIPVDLAMENYMAAILRYHVNGIQKGFDVAMSTLEQMEQEHGPYEPGNHKWERHLRHQLVFQNIGAN